MVQSEISNQYKLHKFTTIHCPFTLTSSVSHFSIERDHERQHLESFHREFDRREFVALLLDLENRRINNDSLEYVYNFDRLDGEWSVLIPGSIRKKVRK